MDKYLDSFREMISLRGLTDHTLKNYCTYIRITLQTFSINHLKMFHGMNFVIISVGFRNPEIFRTVRSTVPFRSFVFLLFMFFINLGMIHSFQCVSLIPISLMSQHEMRFSYFSVHFLL